MKNIILAVGLIVSLSSLASAQTGSGYAFFAPGQVRAFGNGATSLHFGGGGKYFTKSGLGFGGELGLLGVKRAFWDSDIGLLSLNGYYAFKTGSQKLQPFVTGGYTRSFGRESGANMGNFGAGFDYWFKNRVGIMAEFRDHIHREQGITVQMWEIRFGPTFK